MARLRIIPVTLAGVLLLTSTASAGPKEDADRHFADGLALYSEDDYAGASAEFELAYNAHNRQPTLFAWAQAERLQGNCDKSKELLSKYIAKGATTKQSQAAFKLMSDCTPRVVEPPAKDPVLPDTAANTNSGTNNAKAPGGNSSGDSSGGSIESRSLNSPWYRDWVGLSLLTAGTAGLAVGGLAFGNARNLEAEAKGVSYDRFLELRDEAGVARTGAVIFGVAGGAVLLGGVAYILMGDSDEADTLTVQVTGSGVGVAGRF